MGEKRRGAGEGSIYRRKDGRWVGQYEVERKRRYVYGQDREGVRTRLTKALADRDAGLVFDSRNLHDPVAHGDQTHASRYPQVPSQLLPRRDVRVPVVPRLGVEGGHEQVGALVEMIYLERLDSLGHLVRSLRWSLLPDRSTQHRKLEKGRASRANLFGLGNLIEVAREVTPFSCCPTRWPLRL